MMQEDEQAKKARTLIPPKEAIIAPSPNAQQGQEDDAFEQLAEEPQQDCAALGTATLQPASADFSDVLPTTEHNKAPQLDPVQQDGTQPAQDTQVDGAVETQAATSINGTGSGGGLTALPPGPSSVLMHGYTGYGHTGYGDQ
ncbi:hypothetical protein Agub_g15596, partial [Astrephomene gubernaculifera]